MEVIGKRHRTQLPEILKAQGYHTSWSSQTLVIWLHGNYITSMYKSEFRDHYTFNRFLCPYPHATIIQELVKEYNRYA